MVPVVLRVNTMSIASARPASAPPIFILSRAPALIPLVGAMLGRHPDCFGAPELNLLAADSIEEMSATLATRDKSQFHGLLRTAAYLYAGEQSMDAVAMAGRWLLRRANRPTWTIFSELRARVAPLRLVDPSRAYSTTPGSLPRIIACAPDAGFVHVVEPASQEAAASETPPPETLAPPGKLSPAQRLAERRKRNERAATEIEAFLADTPPDRVARLDITELTSDPDQALGAICRQFGLADTPANLERMKLPEASPFAGFGPAGANLGNDPAFLIAATRRRRSSAPAADTAAG